MKEDIISSIRLWLFIIIKTIKNREQGLITSTFAFLQKRIWCFGSSMKLTALPWTWSEVPYFSQTVFILSLNFFCWANQFCISSLIKWLWSWKRCCWLRDSTGLGWACLINGDEALKMKLIKEISKRMQKIMIQANVISLV